MASVTIIDPDVLVDAVEATGGTISEETAEGLLVLAALAINARVWPNELPDDPVPAPLGLIALRVALRIGRATADTSGQVVSESIGTYTYRLGRPLSLDEALNIVGEFDKDLGPWLPAGKRGVYDVSVSGLGDTWPTTWWQRDLDSDDPELAGGVLASS